MKASKKMQASGKTLAVVVGSAFVASLAGTVHAAENPFALKSLSSGYMVADADKMKEGKCSAGKCGASKEMKEGACHADKSMEGASADKAKEGSCHADKSKESAGSPDKK